MAFVHIDFTIPIVLLASAMSGVIVLRFVAGWSERRGRERTQRLLREHRIATRDRTSE